MYLATGQAGVQSWLLLAVTALAGLVVYSDSVFVAFAAAPLLLVPLPAVTAGLARSRDVTHWVAVDSVS
jgi:predicted Co/Zn/Cd cation transporter (cation efflux family)